MSEALDADAVVIGGGYYGCFTALEVKKAQPDWRVMLLEQAPGLFARASSTNQGLLQRGYLYSADPDLAQECVAGVEQFEARFGEAVNHRAQMRYAIHPDSEISVDEYTRFCQKVGLRLTPVESGRPAWIAG